MFNPTHITNSAPTVNDDYSAGFRAGVFWWDYSAKRWYLLEDETTGAADWKNVSGGAITSWDDWTPSYSWTIHPRTRQLISSRRDARNTVSV